MKNIFAHFFHFVGNRFDGHCSQISRHSCGAGVNGFFRLRVNCNSMSLTNGRRACEKLKSKVYSVGPVNYLISFSIFCQLRGWSVKGAEGGGQGVSVTFVDMINMKIK